MMRGRLRSLTIDRLVTLVLAALVAMTGVSMLMPSLAILFAITIVLIPLAALMAIAPTALLWAGPSLLAFLLARRTGATVMVGFLFAALAGAVTAATASILPERANAATAAFAEEFVAGAKPRKVQSGPVDVIVQMQDGWPWEGNGTSDRRCSFSCERALYSGFAKQYAIGTAGDFDPNSIVQRVSIIHEVVPVSAGCDSSMFLGSRAEDGDFPAQTNRQHLLLRDALTGSGRCVKSRRATKVAGDVVLVERRDAPEYETYADRDYDWRLRRISHAERLEVFRHSGGELDLAARYSWVRSEPLARPLRIDLPFNFAVRNPGGWAHHGFKDRGKPIPVGLSAIFTADVAVDYPDAD